VVADDTSKDTAHFLTGPLLHEDHRCRCRDIFIDGEVSSVRPESTPTASLGREKKTPAFLGTLASCITQQAKTRQSAGA
jgi:hypothetical protein